MLRNRVFDGLISKQKIVFEAEIERTKSINERCTMGIGLYKSNTLESEYF